MRLATGARHAEERMGTMAIKSLIVFVDPSPGGEARTRYAVRLAAEHDAHLIGVFITPTGWQRNPADGFVVGAVAVREMVERHSLFEREAAAGAIKNFEALAGRERVTFEFRCIEATNAEGLARLHSLHSDLVVVGYPSPGGLPAQGTPAGMLLATGVPFLIVPESWISDGVANRIVFAWNASREARRAISDALPLMKAAQSVTILVIDPTKNASYGEQPGADVAHYLCRHGVIATVEQRLSNGEAIADVIREFAIQDGSDLIVLGAYSHARTREFIFGGVSRSMLRNITVPTLIAH
jgi:nucleotide-binding universal stress UspA family protein